MADVLLTYQGVEEVGSRILLGVGGRAEGVREVLGAAVDCHPFAGLVGEWPGRCCHGG